jgi:hypothetical protein
MPLVLPLGRLPEIVPPEIYPPNPNNEKVF